MADVASIRSEGVDPQAEMGRVLAGTLIKKRFTINLVKMGAFYSVFLINAGAMGFAIVFPDPMRVIGAGALFCFSLLFLKISSKFKE